MKDLNIEIVAMNEDTGDYEVHVCCLCDTEFEVGKHFLTGEEVIISPCMCYNCEEGYTEDETYDIVDKIDVVCDVYYTRCRI